MQSVAKRLHVFVLMDESYLRIMTLRSVVMVRTRRIFQFLVLQESLIVSEYGVMVCKELLGYCILGGSASVFIV